MAILNQPIFYLTLAVKLKLAISDCLVKVCRTDFWHFITNKCPRACQNYRMVVIRNLKIFSNLYPGHKQDECQELSRVFGTRPYLPHEFLNSHLFSTKIDVFSFGVVLFELATGLKAHDKTRNPRSPFLYDHMSTIDESSLDTIKRVIDKSTPNDEACLNLCQLLIYLGKKCCDFNPNFRPDMFSVLKALETFNPVIVVSDQNGGN